MDIKTNIGIPRNNKHNSEKNGKLEEIILISELNKSLMSPKDEQSKHGKPLHDCQNNFRCYFCEFCDNTSIHGFRFLGERQRYAIEKIWWFVVILCAFFGAGNLIYKSYSKWAKSPVIVTFAPTETPIWKIPFPAVTICPEVKVNKKYLNYSEVFNKVLAREEIPESEEKYFSFFQLVCNDLDSYLETNDSLLSDSTGIIRNSEIDEYLNAFYTMKYESCKWSGRKVDCDDFLDSRYTSSGKCYTFNSLDETDLYFLSGGPKDPKKSREIKKWSLENGYPSSSDLDAYPLRTILAGTQTGFEIFLTVRETDMDYGCGELQGFKVTLHHPAEDPDMDKYLQVPLDQTIFVAVKPQMITADENIKYYKPQERNCYLPGEKALTSYQYYTQQNCMTECLTNYTQKMCGCVGFDVLNFTESNVCSYKNKRCMEQAKLTFFQNDLNFNDNGDDNREITEQCDCLPPCTSIQFEKETSQTMNEWRKMFKSFLKEKEQQMLIEGLRCSRLIIYYKDMQFITSERNELYGTVDFLANCGGLLGLFCGFSFTSSIEILYYLTLRFVCNLKIFGRRVWSGALELR